MKYVYALASATVFETASLSSLYEVNTNSFKKLQKQKLKI